MERSTLAKSLGLRTAEQDTVNKTLSRVKGVGEFLEDLTKAVKDTSLVHALAEAIPWQLSAVAGALAEVAPPIKFIAALLDKATQIRDPDQLAFLACTMAFQRAVEKTLTSSADLPTLPKRSWDVARDIPGPDEGMRFATFSIVEPWNHEFLQHAERLLDDALSAIGFDPDARRRLVGDVRQRFAGELKALIHHPKTRDRFLAFAEAIQFPNIEERTRAAWNDHFDYLRYQFEDRPIFGEEAFSLSDIYVDTQCGVMTFRDLQAGRGSDVGAATIGATRSYPDPFDEEVGGRHDLLASVMALLGDDDFSDAIVIQGPAGAGKSAFTLRLAVELLRRGLRPIRIRFRDLPLKSSNIEDAFPEAIRFWDPETTHSRVPYARPEELFKHPDIFSESTEFEGARICPWVLILDGWDEVSVAADHGFSIRMAEIVAQVRDRYLNRPNRPPVRVILTGRPSDVLAEKGILKKETRVLTLRPLTPDALAAHIHRLAPLLADPLRPEQAIAQRFTPVIQSYKKIFNRLPSNSESISMEVLGLPLLSHLAVRLMVHIPGPDLLPIVENPTRLYLHLTDLTCGQGGRYGQGALEPELEQSDMRTLLHETALAMTVYGKDSMPYEELDVRLSAQNEELLERVQKATHEAPLTSLMISYFFKGGRSELGAEFVHKSFREYLFAEALVEILKTWARQIGSDLSEVPSSDYWKDFSADDPRFQLTRRLCLFLAAQWISPEVGRHLEQLIAWDIERAGPLPAITALTSSLPRLDLKGWTRIREALADLWDWWGEGGHLREQPVRKGKHLDHWTLPYAIELARDCLPTAKGAVRGAQRLTSVDAHLGDGLFCLAASVHDHLARHAHRNGDRPTVVRRYQSVVETDGRWRVAFKPSGAYLRYFHNYANRINAAGWRPWGVFPRGIVCRGLDLRGIRLDNLSFFHDDLSGSLFRDAIMDSVEFGECDLRHCDFVHARLLGTSFYGSRVEGADFTDAIFENEVQALRGARGIDEAIGLSPSTITIFAAEAAAEAKRTQG